MRTKAIVCCLLFALFGTLAVGTAPAQATRALLSKKLLKTDPKNNIPPPEAQIEGACGLAVGSSGEIYVSDYYHRLVDVFSSSGGYMSQITGVASAPEGPCGLAFGPGGALYANIWHERVVRLKPSLLTFDTANSTGVAVDAAGNVYVDDRTFVAVYAPSGAETMKVGLGTLGDGFGVAVSVAGDRIYVPDASDNTVKIYEPAVDLLDPVAVIDGSDTPKGEFVSLVDSSVAADPTTGNLLVVDNLKPEFEHPQAAIYEFDSSGAFVGQLPGAPVHGGPSGIAVDPTTGDLFVTDGNTELSNVFAYGPYTVGGFAPPPPGGEGSSPGSSSVAASTTGSATIATAPGKRSSPRPDRGHRRGKKRKRSRGRVAVAVAAVARLR